MSHKENGRRAQGFVVRRVRQVKGAREGKKIEKLPINFLFDRNFLLVLCHLHSHLVHHSLVFAVQGVKFIVPRTDCAVLSRWRKYVVDCAYSDGLCQEEKLKPSKCIAPSSPTSDLRTITNFEETDSLSRTLPHFNWLQMEKTRFEMRLLKQPENRGRLCSKSCIGDSSRMHKLETGQVQLNYSLSVCIVNMGQCAHRAHYISWLRQFTVSCTWWRYAITCCCAILGDIA